MNVQTAMSNAQMERSGGVLLGQACGEALTRYMSRLPGTWTSVVSLREAAPTMTSWGRGTNISARIAEITSKGAVLTRPRPRAALERRVSQFRDRPRGASQDTTALGAAGLAGLTGLGPEGLDAPNRRTRTADSARAIAEELQDDLVAHDACVLWAEAVRVAVCEARFDLGSGLDLIPAQRRGFWRECIDEATGADPARFAPAHSPERALQMAWAAISSTPVPGHAPGRGSYECHHFQDALQAAARASVTEGPEPGTTVTALAGSLLGARWGLSAVPVDWQRELHGRPGLRARDLIRLGVLTARDGVPTPKGWPSQPHIAPAQWVSPPAARLERLPQLWMGGIGSAGHSADAVVTLCVLGADDVPAKGVAPENHVELWLVSSVDPADNPNHDFALDQAVTAIQTLLDEGHEVLVHCTRAVHRTPQVVWKLLARHGVQYDAAKREVQRTLVAAGYERDTESWATKKRPARGAGEALREAPTGDGRVAQPA